MSILKVARLGHPVLRMKASDLEVADIKAGKFRALIDDMKLALEDIALHRPTLDDVFLSLTGHAAEEEQQEQASSGRRKRGRRRRPRRDG